MKRGILLTLILTSVSPSWAESPDAHRAAPDNAATAQTSDDPIERPLPALSEKERQSLDLAKQWLDTPEKPHLSPDGKVTFLYGATMPTVFCVPLQTADIELEPGERVREGGIHVGDTIRWSTEPAVSGPDEALVTHILIKPKDVNLMTTMVVTTDRRTYYFMLKSTTDQWTPRVGFEYPQYIEQAWHAYHVAVPKAHSPKPVEEVKSDFSQLDFGYSIKGNAPWRPDRVYNDGVKTYIQMPHAMEQTEAPALLVIGADNKEQIVNYRLLHGKYVVDQIFARAELVAGVGRKQTRVEIARVQ